MTSTVVPPSDREGLARKLNLMGEKMGDVEDLLGKKVPGAAGKESIP